MREWIQQLFGRTAPVQPTPEPSHTITGAEVRVRAYRNPRACGHEGYLFELERLDCCEWEPMALVFDDHLRESIVLLQRAQEWVGRLRGPRELPTVFVRDKTYFVDDRLGEMRNVDNPHDRILLKPDESMVF